MAGITTSATTKLYIAEDLPATYTEAGFLAVTPWIAVGDITNFGAYGGTTTVVTSISVDTAIVSKRAGSVNYGSMTMTANRHKGADADAFIAAFNDRQPRSFKMVLPTAIGEQDFFTGIITSIQTNVAGADNMLEYNFTLELDNAVITADVV